MNNPAIVIPCFKKPKALKRLLASLTKAIYYTEVNIVFSVDYSGTNEIYAIADNFEWPYGKKTIIKHSKNIGLRQNILNCGELSKQYGSVIVLEDDTFVSKDFYRYAVNAKNFYLNDDNIAGISLYAYAYSEINHEKFDPLRTKWDTFFMQWTSSWGQLWTSSQWESFCNWYEKNKNKNLAIFNIPQNVIDWPESSWKKYYIAYLYDTKRFFVYPYVSFVSNCGDAGFHCNHESFLYTQVPIPQEYKISSLKFDNFSSSIAKYDSFFQIYPEYLQKENKKLRIYDFDVDISGTKKKTNIKKHYLLSPKRCKKPIFSFDHALLPLALNIANDLDGSYLFFGKTSDFEMQENLFSRVFRWKVNRSLPTGRECFFYLLVKILNKFKLKILPFKM
jgi:hypothetical protein